MTSPFYGRVYDDGGFELGGEVVEVDGRTTTVEVMGRVSDSSMSGRWTRQLPDGCVSPRGLRKQRRLFMTAAS